MEEVGFSGRQSLLHVDWLQDDRFIKRQKAGANLEQQLIAGADRTKRLTFGLHLPRRRRVHHWRKNDRRE